MHGGNAASGRRSGAFRHGKYTKQAIAARAQAELIRKEAELHVLAMASSRWP
jgi:hypothetical protein